LGVRRPQALSSVKDKRAAIPKVIDCVWRIDFNSTL
jgi:hypothetical protein